ncbi:MAG: ABC transporter permease, partial [Spirochaetales bacterium]
MKSAPVLFIAARLLAGREDVKGNRDQARKALRGAVLSIGLSLIPLLTVMQVADGMIQGISARYIELGTYHAQVVPYAPNADLAAARQSLAGAEGLTGAWLETQSVGVAFANGAREGAAIRAVEQGFLDDPGTAAYLRIEAGISTFSGPNDVLVGSAIARKLRLAPGDILNLITVRRKSDGEPLPRISILTVRGIVSAGYRELDSQWLFIRQDAAARILPRDGSRTFIGVKGSDPFGDPDGALRASQAVLPSGFSAYSWRQLERNLFESLASTRTMLLLIMAVTVAVAAVNVSSALTTLVLERRQEIAVLKSLGARPSDLARTFS